MLEGTDATTMLELSRWQRGEVAKHAADGVSYTAPEATLYQLENHTTQVICRGPVTMNEAELVCGDIHIPLDKIVDLAMHGKQTLVFSTDIYYELVPEESSNALKFMWLYQAYKNIGAEKTPAMR
jgi:hypothetical protein